MFERALRTIGTARDAILVAATAAYAAGYVTWALIAWLNNLPPLPLIDAQYLAAGLFPLLSGATFIIIARSAVRVVLDWWPSYFQELPLRMQAFLVGSILLACIATTPLTFPLLRGTLRPNDPRAWSVIAGGSIICILSLFISPFLLESRGFWTWLSLRLDSHEYSRATLFVKRLTELAARWYSGQTRFYLYFMPALLAVTLLGAYVRSWYSVVPQSLGGAKPRVATLDLATSDLSLPTLNDLGVAQHPGSQQVIRTPNVQIIFAGASTVIIRVKPRGTIPPRYVELPRTSIKAFAWQD